MKDDAANRNTFARRARLYENTAVEQAKRIADARAEPPANSRDVTPDVARTAWYQSPSPQPDQDFWQVHGLALQEARTKGIERPEEAADAAAMMAVYPFRAKLVGMGSVPMEIAVQKAERLKRMVDGPDSGKGAA